MENFKIDVDSDGIALITFDVPGRSMNTITASVVRDLYEIAGRIKSDEAIKGAVFASGKESGFCAGADLGEMNERGVAADAKPKSRGREAEGAIRARLRLEQSLSRTGNVRKAGGCRDRRLGARRRLGALSRLPLSRRRGQSQDQARPAGIKSRLVARRGRHATSAAPDRRAERRDDDPARAGQVAARSQGLGLHQ